MSETTSELDGAGIAANKIRNDKQGWLAAGGLIGAVLASSCCIVPLMLVIVGVSGAWIGNLTALLPYKPIFTAISLGFIGLGFWYVYFRQKPVCEEDSFCARPQSSLLTKTVLWAAPLLVTLSATITWWAPFFY